MTDLQTILKAISPPPPRPKFRDFVREAWPLIEPARPFRDNWCMGAVCEHLQAVTDGQIKKLIINIPPGFAKSSTVSVLWAPYDWTMNPWLRWMFASHRMSLAFRDAGRRRNIINSLWYQEKFGHLFQTTSENLKYVTNSAQGSMFSSSVDSQDVLGFRAHRLVLDDPHDPQGAISEVQRATTTEWLNLTWPTRKDDTPQSAEVLVMQRLHELDATGLYLRQGGFTHLKIPMEHKGKSFSFADKRTEVGALIDEQVQSREYVEDKKRRLGPWGEAAQYDQEPMPLGGGIIKSSWFQRWRWSTEFKGFIDAGLYKFDPMMAVRFCTVDLAMTKKEIGPDKLHDPDWTVMAAWCVFSSPLGPMLFLLDLIRMRSEGPESLPQLQGFHDHWKFQAIGVEDIAEKAWYQFALREGLPVREVSTKKSDDVLYTIDKDKVGRALAATVLMARPDHPFYVPEYAPWLAEYLDELAKFPNASHDDQVDVTSLACAIAEKVIGMDFQPPKQETPYNRNGDRSPEEVAREGDAPEGFLSPSPFDAGG